MGAPAIGSIGWFEFGKLGAAVTMEQVTDASGITFAGNHLGVLSPPAG
ncbi:MAG TPA: hypothetical protein VGE61_02915 [Glycomyces sp.]